MNAKKRALGKGLGALLTNQESDNQPRYDIERDLAPVGTVANVPLDLLESNPYQPRTDFDQEALEELAQSIQQQGVIQPVTIRKGENGKFQIISGERRCKAAQIAGLAEVPAYVRVADDQQMKEMAIVENIQRKDLNAMEVAIGYQQLIEEHELTQEVLAEKVGKSRSAITNQLRLLNLPAEVQIGLREEKISAGHARAILSVNNVETQIELFKDIVEQRLSVREVEDIVKNLNENKEKKKPDTSAKNPAKHSIHVQAMEKNMNDYFGSRVKIKVNNEGKGSIVINFSSEQDFERILKLVHR